MASAAPLRAQDSEGIGRLMVRGLEFAGNRAIDGYTLSISIATTNSTVGWQTWGVLRWIGLGEKRFFDEREFRRDVLRLKLLYTQYGFLEAQIDTVVRRSRDAVTVRFLIHEGEPVRVRELAVTGIDSILPARLIDEDLPLAVGDPFNRLLLQGATDSIRIWLQNRGYPFPEVFRSFDVNRGTREATVSFDVDPGPRARIAAVRVVGADEIGEGVIRRTVPLREGNLFRLEDIYEAQRDLYRTNLFNYVRVVLEDSLPDGPGDSLVTVQIAVTEGNLHTVRAGAGYGSIDCFRGVVGWTARNFLGGARTFDVTGRVSKIGAGDPFPWGFQNNVCVGLSAEQDSSRLDLNYNLTASLREPHLFSRRTSGVLSVFAEKRSEFQAYLREVVGGEIAVTQQFGIPVTFSYSLQYGRTAADPATFCTFLNVCLADDTVFSERLLESTVGISMTRDRANSPLDPSRGNRATADIRWASTIIGSDTLAQYLRAQGQFASYHRLGRSGIFAWRIRLGTIVPPRVGFEGQETQFVPPDKRFYGGGPNSVRGFGQNQLGPLVRVFEPDAQERVTVINAQGDSAILQGRLRTSPTGGNFLYFANAEIRAPLPAFNGRLSGAIFIDAGQVFERGDELISFSDVRVTPGLGLRFSSPLGPVRLDVAYNVYDPELGQLYELVEDPTTNEVRLDLIGEALRPLKGSGLFDRLQLHFSVGQAF